MFIRNQNQTEKCLVEYEESVQDDVAFYFSFNLQDLLFPVLYYHTKNRNINLFIVNSHLCCYSKQMMKCAREIVKKCQ